MVQTLVTVKLIDKIIIYHKSVTVDFDGYKYNHIVMKM